jgi:hypothetical protein
MTTGAVTSGARCARWLSGLIATLSLRRATGSIGWKSQSAIVTS